MSSDITIPRPLKQQAMRAITAFDRAYYKEGGIRELEAKVQTAREGISTTIYKLALSVRRKNKDLKQAAAMFRATCAYAEENYKEQHGIANVTTRIPAWAQFKSRITRAMRNGLDPAEYDSERALRDALRDKLQKEREEREPEQPETVTVTDFLKETGVHDQLRVALSRVVLEAEYIKANKRNEAERILAETAKALHALVDKRKIKDDATKAALAEAA